MGGDEVGDARVIEWFRARGADVDKLTDWTAVGGATYYIEGAGRRFDVTRAEFAEFALAADLDEREVMCS